MKYDFDKLTNRRNGSSLKWDVKQNELPMWVADMDFETCPALIKKMTELSEKGIFGYAIENHDYFEEYRNWFKRRHNINYEIDWMIYSTGVVAALSSIVRKLTTVGENVLIMSPVYNIFYNCILNNGRNVVSSDLIYENGKYEINFNDLENKMKNEQTTLLILCNPHNPIGKNLTKDELIKICTLAKKYGLIVVSDEIHCDVNKNINDYVPFLSVSKEAKEIGIACHAMSKAFNIAGLQSACIVIPNKFLRHKVWREINTSECGEPNCFAIDANITCLKEGEEWLNQLNEYIFNNKKYFYEEIKTKLPFAKLSLSDATYLMWVDVSHYAKSIDQLVEFIRNDSGLIVTSGTEYGKNGEGFIRINLATQFERVKDGTNRLIKSILRFSK